MKFLDAYTLAATKRKTRRIRTALVVIVSALLFAVLFFVSFTVTGLLNGAKQVQYVGFNSHYLVQIMRNPSMQSQQDYEALQQQIESQMDNELRARHIKVTAETKIDQSYLMELSTRLNREYTTRMKVEDARTEQQVRSLGKPTAVYHFTTLPIYDSNFRYQPDSSKDPLADELTQKEETGTTKPDPYKVSNNEISYHQVEQGMLSSQLQPGQSFDWQPGQAYPVTISYAYLEKLAGTSLVNVSPEKKIEGYRKLMAQFAGKELTYCYRNSTAQAQLQNVIHYNKTARTDKDSKTNPLDVPVCGGFDQAQLKKLKIIQEVDKDAVKPLFPQPAEPAPQTQTVHLKIVAFVPSIQQYNQDIISQTVSGIASLPTYSQYPIIFTSEVVARDPLLSSLVADESMYQPMQPLFADFKNRDEQAAYIAQSCKGNECNTGERPIITPFGNLNVALENIVQTLTKFALIAVAAIIVIAGLMIMFTMSKVIADSSKEIAVFRALGARRRDIAHIYYTYGAMLTASAAVLAVVLACAGAYTVSHMYGDRIATTIVHGTGAYNTSVHVTLLGLRADWLLVLVVALVAAAFIGVSIPLITSLRRKLINILREE